MVKFNSILLLGLALAHFPLQAEMEFNPDTMIKVDKNNKANCVEYYNYKGELYCSTTANRLKQTPTDYAGYEQQTIVFDDRPWNPAWGQKTDAITTVEYIPEGDKIKNWHELVTSQYIPNMPKSVTPKKFSEEVIKYLKDSGLDPTVNIISETPNRVLFEFQVLEPENLKQHELQLISKGSNGMYVLHYVIKEAPMDEQRRTQWIERLNKSKQP